MTDTTTKTHDHPAHPTTVTVDDEPVTTEQPDVTPNNIMTAAGVDPTTHYLVQVEGRHQTSYQGKGDVPIHVHEHEVFITVNTGPTPVS
jgi:hypothetical protein